MRRSDLPGALALYFVGSRVANNRGGADRYGWIITGEDGREYARGRGDAPGAKALSSGDVAEWCALGFGLKWLAANGWKGRLMILGDGKMVVRQLEGDWRCKAECLDKLRERCVQLLQELGGDFKASWVPREKSVVLGGLSKWSSERTS